MDSVLIIDDEKNIRALLMRVLAEQRLDVHAAASAAEGLQKADEVDPDVILLDLRLPDANGLDVLKTLKSRHPEAAVLMVTAFGQVVPGDFVVMDDGRIKVMASNGGVATLKKADDGCLELTAGSEEEAQAAAREGINPGDFGRFCKD